MSIRVIPTRETKRIFHTFRSDRLFFSKKVKDAIENSWYRIGSDMVRSAENAALNEPKTGRWYPSGSVQRKDKDNHRASAPYQSPAFDGRSKDSENYYDNFEYQVHGWRELEFGNNTTYAEYLEFGTVKKDGSPRMLPRPGIQNAIKDNIRNSRVEMETNIGRNLKL